MATLITIHSSYHTQSCITNARAEALFASHLSRFDTHTPARITTTVRTTVKLLGTRGCAAAVAQAYGDCPETAIMRMAWALTTVHAAYGE